jgi:hypothetical protein
MGQIKIHLPRLPHGEQLEIGQQTKLGQKRREPVVGDLKNNVVRSLQIALTIAPRASQAL